MEGAGGREFLVVKEGWMERELEGAVDVGERGDRGV